MNRNVSNTLSTRACMFSGGIRGFSLVEVMMTLVLVALGAALAIPSYQEMMEQRQVTNSAEQLASFINTAQKVAVEKNEVVTISYARTGVKDWCIGAVKGEAVCDCTETKPAAEGYCQIASQPFIISNESAGDLDLVHDMEGDGAYAFDPLRGMFLDLDDSLSLELRSKNSDYRLNLLVNSTGRVRVCSDEASQAVPGYETCQAVAAAN